MVDWKKSRRHVAIVCSARRVQCTSDRVRRVNSTRAPPPLTSRATFWSFHTNASTLARFKRVLDTKSLCSPFYKKVVSLSYKKVTKVIRAPPVAPVGPGDPLWVPSRPRRRRATGTSPLASSRPWRVTPRCPSLGQTPKRSHVNACASTSRLRGTRRTVLVARRNGPRRGRS